MSGEWEGGGAVGVLGKRGVDFIFTRKPVICSGRWGLYDVLWCAGVPWRHQRRRPSWPPSWILPKIRSYQKGGKRIFYPKHVEYKRSCVRACVRARVHSFIHSFIHLFLRSFIRLFVPSFIRSFVHLFSDFSFFLSFVPSSFLPFFSFFCFCLSPLTQFFRCNT